MKYYKIKWFKNPQKMFILNTSIHFLFIIEYKFIYVLLQ